VAPLSGGTTVTQPLVTEMGKALDEYWKKRFPAQDVANFYNFQLEKDCGFKFGYHYLLTRSISYRDVVAGKTTIKELAESAFASKNYFTAGADLTERIGSFQSPPLSVHVGATWRNPTKDVIARPMRDYFKIDIDITDYEDERRKCGCGADKTKLCSKCWTLGVTVAATIYEKLNAEYFVLAAFSGSRGFHLYVFGCKGGGERPNPAFATEAARRELVLSLQKITVTTSAFHHKVKVRIDEAVSTRHNHPVRALFSPHTNSGLVCIPIDVRYLTQTPSGSDYASFLEHFAVRWFQPGNNDHANLQRAVALLRHTLQTASGLSSSNVFT
jgi:hypothetical protein